MIKIILYTKLYGISDRKSISFKKELYYGHVEISITVEIPQMIYYLLSSECIPNNLLIYYIQNKNIHKGFDYIRLQHLNPVSSKNPV